MSVNRTALTATILYALLIYNSPLGAQSTAIKAQTDSIRAETCRGGRLSATGLSCSGAKQSPRVTVLRRLANRIDSLVRVVVAVPADTVLPVPVPVPPVDTVPTPPPVDTATAPPTPPTPSPVELPRVLLSFPMPTSTRTVTASTALQFTQALNSRQPGDEIVLQNGQTYAGNFAVTSCLNGWLTIRAASVPVAIGQRMTPGKASNAPRLVTTNTSPALHLTAASCKVRLIGIDVSVAPTVTQSVYGLIRMEGAESVLDRVYVHGHDSSRVIRCVTMNGSRQQVSDSWLDLCRTRGSDSQAIHGALGPGPFRIVNNTLIGAGENIMFGGQNPPAGSQLIPADIEIRGNDISKPANWKGHPLAEVKNLIELKNATRVLVEGNVLDGSWGDGQTGWAMIVKSANQDCGAARWSRSTDVTVRLNRIQNVSAGVNVSGSVCSDSVTARIAVMENWVTAGVHNGDKRGFQTLGGTRSVTLARNVLEGTPTTAMWIEGGVPCDFTGNQLAYAQYSIMGSGVSGATSTLNKYCGTGWTYTGNVLVKATTVGTPEALAVKAAVQQATAGVVVPP